MTQPRYPTGERRKALAIRELESTRRSPQVQFGPTAMFMRVTLVVIFMYLVVISYAMFGIIGPVFVSVLSLVAHFVPYLYDTSKKLLQRREARPDNRSLGQESPQEV